MPQATIDVASDKLIPVITIAQQRLGKRISPPTLWRWRRKGVVVGERRVKLECLKVGCTWCTTDAAFTEFIRAQNPPTTDANDSTRDPATRHRLEEAGLLL